MYPVLFTIGPLSISSFGFFLALAYLLSVFAAWRLAKVYDLKQEKILDLAILAFFGAIAGARVLFVATHFALFDTPEKILFVTRYPGISFWGGVMGGVLALWFFLKRAKMPFWQVLDFAAVSMLLGIAIGDVGCFLGGCNYGVSSDIFFAVTQVGALGKRLPLSAFEGVIFLIAFAYLFNQTVRFHFAGKITALSLMVLGIVKFLTQFYRGENSVAYIFPFLFFILGVSVFYKQSKRKLLSDAVIFIGFFTSSRVRSSVLLTIQKSWYNGKIGWKVRVKRTGRMFSDLPTKLRRRLNVKPTPKNIS